MKVRVLQLELAALALGVVVMTASRVDAAPGTATNSFPAEPLSLAEAVNIALQQNPDVLRAQKDVEAVQGIVIQTRAAALPKASLAGKYQAVEPSAVDNVTINLGSSSFTFGTDQNWSSQLKLVQSLYEGGRVVSSIRAAKLQNAASLLNYQTRVADAVLATEVAYYGVLLAEQQIIVQEASVDLLTKELADTTRRYDAGTVPHFNVLRAEVELANQRPKLIRARNSFRIAKNILANALGLPVPKETQEDIPLRLSGKLEKVPLKMELTQAIAQALENRTELAALRKDQARRKEGITTARAGLLPSAQAFAGYGAQSSTFTPDLSYEVHGWLAGVQVSWDIFDGQLTKGKMKEATALFEKSGIELDDAGRRIELEVRTSYSTFIEADEVLESQKKVVEQADEALRLASSRAEAGAGTQLDVLSAQTALTDARTTQIQALHDYAVARARLERAVGSVEALRR